MKVLDLFRYGKMSTAEMVDYAIRRNRNLTEAQIYNAMHRQREIERKREIERLGGDVAQA